MQNNTRSAGTLTINAPTGTPTEAQRLILRLRTASVQMLSWNAVFEGSAAMPLPSESSGLNTFDYFGFFYSTADSRWHLLSYVGGF